MSFIIRRLSSLALTAAMLAACSHVPVSTMWALRNFDAASVDPAVLRAAVRLPESFEPQKGGVTLKIGWWRDGEEKAKHEMTFALKETTAPEDVAPLAGEKKEGTRIYAFRVDPADYAAIRARQKEFLHREGAQSWQDAWFLWRWRGRLPARRLPGRSAARRRPICARSFRAPISRCSRISTCATRRRRKSRSMHSCRLARNSLTAPRRRWS